MAFVPFLLYNLQAKLKSIESQLNEALNASDARSTIGSESASVISSPKITESTADSLSVTKRLEEELAKRDALIEVLINTPWDLSSLSITCSTLNACNLRSLFCSQLCNYHKLAQIVLNDGLILIDG